MFTNNNNHVENAASGHSLNFIMLGTNEHRDNMHTVLTQLADCLANDAMQTVHLINGIGGVSKKSNGLPMLGTTDFSCCYDIENHQLICQRKLRETSQQINYVDAILNGAGYKDAKQEMRKVIDAMLAHDTNIPLTINFFGFSRGADTNLRMANELKQLYGSDRIREVNILSIDQVPGPDRANALNAKMVPDNIKHFVQVLMEDDKRSLFAAQDISKLVIKDNKKTQFETFLLNGTHSSATRFIEDPFNPDSKTTDAGILLWDIVQRFLKQHKIRMLPDKNLHYTLKDKDGYRVLDEAPTLTNAHRLAAYTKMQFQKEVYIALNTMGIMGHVSRNISENKKFYFLHGHTFFQDKQHMLLFQEMYPALFDYFFQNNINQYPLFKIHRDFLNLTLKQDLPGLNTETYARFIQHIQKNLLDNNSIDAILSGKVALPAPRGIPIAVKDYYAPDNEIRLLWEGTLSAVFSFVVGDDICAETPQIKQLLDDLYEIIIANSSTKLQGMQSAIHAFIVQNVNGNLILNQRLRSLININKVDLINDLLIYIAAIKEEKAYVAELKKMLPGLQNIIDNLKNKNFSAKETDSFLNDIYSGLRLVINNYPDMPFERKQIILQYMNTEHSTVIDAATEILSAYIKQRELVSIGQDQDLARDIAQLGITCLQLIKQNYTNNYSMIANAVMDMVQEKLAELGEKNTEIKRFKINYPGSASVVALPPEIQEYRKKINLLCEEVIVANKDYGAKKLSKYLKQYTKEIQQQTLKKLQQAKVKFDKRDLDSEIAKITSLIKNLASNLQILSEVQDKNLAKTLIENTIAGLKKANLNTQPLINELSELSYQLPGEEINEMAINTADILEKYNNVINTLFPGCLSTRIIKKICEHINDKGSELSNDKLADYSQIIKCLYQLNDLCLANNMSETMQLVKLIEDNKLFNDCRDIMAEHLRGIEIESQANVTEDKNIAVVEQLKSNINNYNNYRQKLKKGHIPLSNLLAAAFVQTFYLAPNTKLSSGRILATLFGIPSDNTGLNWLQYAISLGFIWHPLKNSIKLVSEYLFLAAQQICDFVKREIHIAIQDLREIRNAPIRLITKAGLYVALGIVNFGDALATTLWAVTRCVMSPIAAFNAANTLHPALGFLSGATTTALYTLAAILLAPITVPVGLFILSKLAITNAVLNLAPIMLPAKTVIAGLMGLFTAALVGLRGIAEKLHDKFYAIKTSTAPGSHYSAVNENSIPSTTHGSLLRELTNSNNANLAQISAPPAISTTAQRTTSFLFNNPISLEIPTQHSKKKATVDNTIVNNNTPNLRRPSGST